MGGKKLYKSRDDKMVDGVCAGVAEYLNMDPTLVRLAWGALCIFGAGVMLYILAMIVIPRKPY